MSSFADFVASRPAVEEQMTMIRHYADVLCEALADDFRRNAGSSDHTFDVEEARKYHKVWMYRYGKRDSIHAFIDKKTGDVYKPASTKAPAKGIRFNVLDQASRDLMLQRADWAGGYLYLTK